MNKETRATLEIIIREVQDIIIERNATEYDITDSAKKIMELLQTWIDANNLHPEKVIRGKGVYMRQEKSRAEIWLKGDPSLREDPK